MDKQAFLSLLRERLTAYKADEENINKYIKQFERYFNTMTDDEIHDQIMNYDGVEGIAQNIIKLINKKKEMQQKKPSDSQENAALSPPVIQLKTELNADALKEQTRQFGYSEISANSKAQTTRYPGAEKSPETGIEETTPETGIKNESDHNESIQSGEQNVNYKKRNSRGFSTPDMSVAADPEIKEKTTDFRSHRIADFTENKKAADKPAADLSENAGKKSGRPVINDKNAINQKNDVSGSLSENSEYYENRNELIPSALTEVKKNAANNIRINLNELDETFAEDTAVPYTPLFFLVIIMTMPLSLPLFLTVLFLFLAVFSFLSVLIVGLIAGLIFIIIAGTGLSLVGIIYGVTQSFVSLPVGLFEIGFGVIIGGCSLLLGILIYNAAIRLLPFAIKYLIMFFMFVMDKIKNLFMFVKRECAVR